MKNHRFPWLRNRTTDNRKCEKARNIKEKRTIEMFSTVSRKHVELRSSASVEFYSSAGSCLQYLHAQYVNSILRGYHVYTECMIAFFF